MIALKAALFYATSSNASVGLDMVIDDTPFNTRCIYSSSGGGYFGDQSDPNIECTFEILAKINSVLKF